RRAGTRGSGGHHPADGGCAVFARHRNCRTRAIAPGAVARTRGGTGRASRYGVPRPPLRLAAFACLSARQQPSGRMPGVGFSYHRLRQQREQAMALNSARIEKLVHELLVELGEDPDREGLLKTPHRVAGALEFLTSGSRTDPASVINDAIFTQETNSMVIVK